MRFTTLDWGELRIDSVLPVYTEVIPLESDYRLHDYTVTLEYPEYVPLNAQERKVVERFADKVEAEIQVETYVGVQRGQGLLDVSFVPIVKRDGKYQKLQSCRLVITPKAKPNQARRVALQGQKRYADHSVLSSGKWVKIAITQDGIYSLTRANLKKMGFSNPDNVHLYGYGGHRQNATIDADTDFDDLEEIPLYKQNANSWLFWGNGLLYWVGNKRVSNHYARAACYFLTEGDAVTEIETISSVQDKVQNTYTTFTANVLHERDEYAWFSAGNCLYENTNYANSNSHTYKLETPYSAGNERLTVAFTAGAETPTTLQTTVNGTTLDGNITLAALSKYIYATTGTKTFDVSKLTTEEDKKNWTIKLTSTAGNDARLDYLSMFYSRYIAITPEEGFVAFSQTGSGVSQFDVACNPENTVIMRVGRRAEPAVLISGTQKDDVTLSVCVDDPTRSFVAFDKTYSFPEPTFVGAVENQDLHALDSLDMVILIPASGKLLQQAKRLAEAHLQYDGLKVGIVRADQVYNEFSSGTPDATAYRRLMKMLYDKAKQPEDAPRYLLLMGDGAWDNRMLSVAWRNTNPDDYLLCYESDNSYSETKSYVMEDYFGLLDDGEGKNVLKDKVDIGIGRFPVVTASEAKVLVDKSIRHMSQQNAGAWKNVVCMLGDDGDENEHMRYADDVAELIMNKYPELEVRKVMWDAFIRVSSTKNNTYPEVEELLKKQMDEGALVVNYSGHANTYTLSHEFVLNVEDFAAFKSDKLPLWVTAACDVMPFDGQSANIGETAVLNPNGGAVAFYGTTRTVYASQNLAMNRYFMQYLFGKDALGNRYRVGDAIRLAKSAIVAGNAEGSYLENKVQYVLLGDPALLIGAPQQHIVLDSINGVEVAEEPVTLKAGSKVQLSGHVEAADGALLPDFQGILSARVYDSEKTITCKNNAGASNAFTFTNRDDVLYNAQDSIRNGLFDISFTVPVDINYSNDSGRIVFYAINEDKTMEANGYSERFTLGGISSELDDKEGPEIYAFLNDDEFQDGDEVCAQPFFVALLQDENGVNVNGNGLGHDLQLCIDNRPEYTFILNDYYTGEFGDYTRGVVSFTLPVLEAGEHTLTFRAWDVLNNTSATTLQFKVNPALKPHVLQLAASQNPALTHTNFLISYDRPGSLCTFTVEVFDFAGRLMWSHTEQGSSVGTYSIPWDLSMGAGGKLRSGVYLYRATLQTGESKEVSKTQKIIVLNNK